MRRTATVLGYIWLAVALLALMFFPLMLRAQNYASVATTRRFESSDGSWCSSTVLGPHAVMTAGHCLYRFHTDLKLLPATNEHPKIEFFIADNYDHAIVFLSGIEFAEYASISPTHLAPGDDVFMVGNAGQFTQLLRKGYYAGSRQDPDDSFQLLFDMNVFFGDSGAAIFNRDGQIVSIISTMPFAAQGPLAIKFVGAYPLHFTQEQLKQAREWKP